MAAIELIRTLEPKPGDRLSAGTAAYVAPDVVVYRHGNRWQVDLSNDPSRYVHLNRDYQRLLRKNGSGGVPVPPRDRQTNRYLNNAFKEARWFIRTLEQRDETILRVARAIVERQHEFLDRGDCAMCPLTMREIAAEVGVHESTVSRAISQKYALTPHGIFELKRFFSSQVGAEDGSGHSATAIQAMIREIVESEPSDRPASDSAIVGILKERGITVARRTVAKYRELLGIPPSSKRRSLF
jgi:RNA polymerase sigma-54 factor